MKATRLKPGQMVNPYYSAEVKRAAKSRGEAYDIPAFLNLPVGETVDDPDCWKLCVGEDPVMKPADDECREKVLSVMSEPKRIAFLRNLQRQNQSEVRKQMPKGQIEWLDSMLETYGAEIDKLDAKPAPAPARKPVPPTTPAS